MKRNAIRRNLLVASSLASSLFTVNAHAQHAKEGSAPAPTAAPVFAPAPTSAVVPTLDIVSSLTPAPVSTPKPVKPLSGEVQPKWGNIRTFWGDVSPYWGNIRTFWGDVSPYEGDLSAFWGNIRTFNDTNTGSTISPYWGNIRTFWGDLGASWGNIRTFWGNIRTFNDAPEDYGVLAGQLNEFYTKSQLFWGDAVTAQTGKSFGGGFADPLLAKYGIDLSDPSTLAKLDVNTRERFFMEWHDGLMQFSGADQVDHWMKAVNWTPSITQTIGEGKDSVIGLLDFTVTGDGTKNITKYDGISNFSNGHGAAVASLMIAAHDGKGVMGIAPMASVVAYNPFDETGTASWGDVRNGVLMLAQNGASIVNMSLGVPGWTLHQGWNDVFSDMTVAAATKNTIFVVAAGNDGVTQTQNVNWNYATNPKLIIVGSVDPTGTISSFSNRPGTACMLNNGVCGAGNRLMDRFIVAPGEFVLVADGQGGVMRMSGTSFAAPLVSGTIALLHDRWPWLSNYPKESVDIILRSARDLGAPGVDPIYGVGMLDVTAAMSPLSFEGLQWYEYKDGRIKPEQSTKIRNAKEVAKWEAKGMFFYAYEDIGATFRDFAIPMSSKLVGQSALSAGGSMEQLQAYIYSRFLAWVNAGSPKGGKGFTGFSSSSAPVQLAGGMTMTMSVAPRTHLVGYRQNNVPYQTAVRLADPEESIALTFGEGDGAVMIGGSHNFGMVSDYDPFVGGGNPLLGFASGGGYAQVSVALNDGLSISTSLSQRELKRDLTEFAQTNRMQLGGVEPYRATAHQVAVSYRPISGVKLTGSYTRLQEDDALLGVQSLDRGDFDDGSTTEGTTLGLDIDVTPTLSVAATGTLSRTLENGNGDSGIAVANGGLVSTSFQMGIAKTQMFDRNDRVRFTLSQPMHLERGSLDLTQVRVIDRQTGELGPVTQKFDIAVQSRQLVSEVQYGRMLLDGMAEMNLFGRVNLNGAVTDQLPAFIGGATFRLTL